MISFYKDPIQFRFRVAGVAIYHQNVLLNRLANENFWFMPGGGVNLQETSNHALLREMHEELHEQVKVRRLLWIVEHIFQEDLKIYHSLSFFYRMAFQVDSPVYRHQGPFPGKEEQEGLVFQWHCVNDLENLILYPTFLRTALRTLPKYPVHLLDLEINT